VLRETGLKNFVASSTGNTAVAYARYLTAAGISFYAFIPENASITQAAEVGCFGQNVFRVKGDYTRTKEMAMAFARKHKMPLAGGNFDPMRIEAKKTMMLEWVRILTEFPTVYIQALSGGTGPMAIAKGCRDLAPLGLGGRLPRFILCQSSRCAPMAAAWKEAEAKGFPEGWEKTYPIYHNPQTSIATLAAGFPKTYPVLAPLVRESGGAIFAFDEEATPLVSRIVAFERSVRIGPAAAIGLGGFFEALKHGAIRDGDRVLINIGEGIRRAPEFLATMFRENAEVGSIEDCRLSDRPGYRDKLWAELEEKVMASGKKTRSRAARW
jgi:threonine synthase